MANFPPFEAHYTERSGGGREREREEEEDKIFVTILDILRVKILQEKNLIL